MNNSLLPKHLGGHSNINHIDLGALEFICNEYTIKSLLDIGCGLGEMKYLCDKNSISYMGIDGDFTVKRSHSQIVIHDYTQGKSSIQDTYDLAWSTEFVEHVEKQYVDNFMNDFAKCKYALISHAPVGKHGYHHVNCQNSQYWIKVFEKYGFTFMKEHTNAIQLASTMKRDFIRKNGLFFSKKS